MFEWRGKMLILKKYHIEWHVNFHNIQIFRFLSKSHKSRWFFYFVRFSYRFANRYKIDFRRTTPILLLSRKFLLYRAIKLCIVFASRKTRDALNASDKYYAITDIVQLIAYQIERHSFKRVLAYLAMGVYMRDNNLLVIVLAISLNPSLDWEWFVLVFMKDVITLWLFALTASLLSLLQVAWREYFGLLRQIFDYNTLYTDLFFITLLQEFWDTVNIIYN